MAPTTNEGLMATLAGAWKACGPLGYEQDLPSNDLLPPDAYVASDAHALLR